MTLPLWVSSISLVSLSFFGSSQWLLAGAEDTVVRGAPKVVKGSVCGSRLRVMTFNTWLSGEAVSNGLAKIAKHIVHKDPDIVALQEIGSEQVLQELQNILGHEWSYRYRPPCVDAAPDVAIFTKHTIADIGTSCERKATKATIRLAYEDNSIMYTNFWSLHLNYRSYGPYAACNRLVTNADQIEAAEMNFFDDTPGRIQDLSEMLNSTDFRRHFSADELLIIAGDFNSPSHLDWVESTRDGHCGWTFAWPVTQRLQDFGFTDAFREVHPDPAAVPGETWSPSYKHFTYSGDIYGYTIPEPQDRIDFIFYKSQQGRWRVANAEVYFGNEQIQTIPNHFDNDWPSDHASVIADFVFSCER